jgi:DegV family protein with EDD domain
MSSTAVVTDSTSDIPKQWVDKYDITVVPLSVIFENESFKDDGMEITTDQFYKKIADSPTLPKSAQPSPGDFIETYSKLLNQYDNIISIHISRKMSGTIASAEMAKNQIGSPRIELIDSELVHMPLGFLVLKAAQLSKQGKEFSEIIEEVHALKGRIKALFIPRTLEYLQKGGRIGRAKSLIASLLEIKPVLTLKYGEVSQFKTTRRWNQAKNELISSMGNMVDNPNMMVVSVADSEAPEDGDEMKARIEKAFSPKQVIRVEFGCILGTHIGPGAIGITFYEDY